MHQPTSPHLRCSQSALTCQTSPAHASACSTKGPTVVEVDPAKVSKGVSCSPPPLSGTNDRHISSLGWGPPRDNLQTHAVWSSQEMSLSINLFELGAFHQACKVFQPELRGLSVQVVTDCMAAMFYLNPQDKTGLCSHCGMLRTSRQLPYTCSPCRDCSSLAGNLSNHKWSGREEGVQSIFLKWRFPLYQQEEQEMSSILPEKVTEPRIHLRPISNLMVLGAT